MLDVGSKDYTHNSGLISVSGFFREYGERGGSSILVRKQLRLLYVKFVNEYENFAIKHCFEVWAIEIATHESIFIMVCIYI